MKGIYFLVLVSLVAYAVSQAPAAQPRKCFILPSFGSTAITWNYNSTDVYEQVIYLDVVATAGVPKTPTNNGRGLGWKLLRKRWHNLALDQITPGPPPVVAMYHFWYDDSSNTYSRMFYLTGATIGSYTTIQDAQAPTFYLDLSENVTACSYTFT